MSPKRVYLYDSITSNLLYTVSYNPDKPSELLAGLLEGIDTPKTFTIEIGGETHKGVCVRSAPNKDLH